MKFMTVMNIFKIIKNYRFLVLCLGENIVSLEYLFDNERKYILKIKQYNVIFEFFSLDFINISLF